jgi:hypothetical protein
MMVFERFYGAHEHFSGWRCVLCGEIIDEVIVENRQAGIPGQNKERRRQRYT